MKTLSKIACWLVISFSLDATALDRKECRSSKDQEIIIQCINENIYDPCEDAGGKWGASQCGWAHAEIARKKIQNLEIQIAEAITANTESDEALEAFKKSTNLWASYRDSHCSFTNSADDLSNFSSIHLQLAFCIRRLNEVRANELEEIISRSSKP